MKLRARNTTEIRWDDLRVPVTATRRQGSRDPDFNQVFDNGSGSQGVFAQVFDDNTEEELYFEVQLPHAWLEGSDIEAHVHWFPIDTGASGEVVSWGLEYTWASIGSAFGNTTIISGNSHTPADAALVIDKHYITELGTISGTGNTLSSMLICRVFRDATGALKTDDYGDDAGLLEIDFHIQLDDRGSTTEYTK